MAVIYQNGGNGLLGTLGTLATLAGTFIPGAEWLSTLGLGMNAANSIMNGQSPSGTPNGKGQSALEQIMNGLKGKTFQNPASGNMIKQNEIDELYSRGWGRYS